jgi:hypothetical protein
MPPLGVNERADMKFPRFSLAAIGFAILVIAVDFAVIRSAFRNNVNFEGWAIFAFLLLPMLDALMFALYRLRRPGRRSARAIGFFVSGTVATLVVFVSCLIAPDSALGMLRAVGRPIALASLSGLTRLFGSAALRSWAAQLTLGVTFELVLPLAFFCLPPLFFALVGGWVATRLGPARRIAGVGLDQVS